MTGNKENKKEASVITARDMKRYIFEEGVIPMPVYTQANEVNQIVQPRGTIFTGKKDINL